VTEASARPGALREEPEAASVVHQLTFYEDDAALAATVGRFLGEDLGADDRSIVIATEPHRRAILRELAARGLDPERLRSSGRLVVLDARDTLAKILHTGEPDPRSFAAEVGSLVASQLAAARGGRLRAYGEMVDVLWQEGRKGAAVRLEELWNDLLARHPFTLLCAYAAATFEEDPHGIARVCAAHDRVRDGAGDEPSRAADVQRLAREIGHRVEVERALRASVVELRKREDELRRSESQLAAITDMLPTLVAYIDRDLRYRFTSAAYERWFGLRRSELVGRTLEEVLGPAAFAAVRPRAERALAGETVTFEDELPYRAGGARFVEATYVPQRGDGGDVVGFVAHVADMTVRRGLERYRAAAAARAERLLKITSAVAGAVTHEEVHRAIVDEAASAVSASSAGLWLVDERGRSATLAREIGYSERARAACSTLSLVDGPTSPAVDCLLRGEALWISSPEQMLRDYPAVRRIATPGRSYRVCCLPLASQGRPLGVLGLTIEDAQDASDDERSFLLLVARYASQAIERLRLLEAERRSRAEADAAASRAEQLYRFAQSVVTADELEQVLDAGLDALEVALGTDRAAVLLRDEGGTMRFRAWRGLSETYRRAVDGHSPWAPDATAPEPILVPDALADPAMKSYLPIFEAEGIRSLAFVPLVARGALVGKLMVYYPEAHAYSDIEIGLASAIGNHLASVSARFAAMAALEQTIRYNELFAGVLAHDLRNPLGAISTAAQVLLMRHEGEGDRTAKPVSRILASGQRMSRMIDQLLDFTRARVGNGIEVQPRETNLADLSSQAIAELELAYPEWTIRREVVGEQGGVWDPDRLLQVISNLVANAGQHGDPAAGVLVRLDGNAAEDVVFAVHNAGAVPSALLPGLFDPFRGTGHRRDHSRGLGLGLFIVKEIVRAHGGTVDVSSSAADGTTFTIRLPRRVTRRPGSLHSSP
jgi:PAS domain S-box-containing protein